MACHRRFYLSMVCLLGLFSVTLVSGQAGSNPSKVRGTHSHDRKTPTVLVAYQSKYGSTKQYAQWIQQDFRSDQVDIEIEKKPPLADYDIIVIGGYIRAGHIVIAPFIRDHWNVLKKKKLVLFTTSATPPNHPNIRTIYEKSLPEEIRREIKYFPLPGRISSKDLTLWDQVLIAIGKMLETNETLKKDMGKDFNGVKRENLLPLIKYLNEIREFPAEKAFDR